MNAGGRVLTLLCAASLLVSCATATDKAASGPVQPPGGGQQGQAAASGTDSQASGKEFVASKELYQKTFNEVQAVIAALTKIISERDYAQWLTYLTTDYVSTTGSKEFLAEASQSGVLKKNGIVLKNLEDYFNNVVVRSRLQARLEDINFVDVTHVKAVTRIQGSPVILYYLVQEEGRWKVGILPGETK
jgi:hypothetical protein